ncbi:MAG TPA: radical SAM protein [Acidimicrobiales bacterium]|nr:radical SAM protein [Acidimicrobiales bacterium]
MIPFESFSYPLFDLAYRADHEAVLEAFLASPAEDVFGGGLKGLYVHIPFCDTICDFCPFVKSVGSEERIRAYMGALHRELETLGSKPRMAEWTLDAVYIGGGTPSVLSEEQLTALVTTIRKSFRLSPDVEITFEVEPKSATDSKLATMAGLGATRVSFGVQTLDPTVRTLVNLTATLDDVYRTIELSTKHFARTNVDMMVGFPSQTRDSVLAEMDEIGRSGIGSVSVYPVDYVMTMPGWLDRIRRGQIDRPASLAERSDQFHEARAALMKHFDEQNMYCFGTESIAAVRYMFEILYGTYRDECVGVGSGAYSFMRGIASYNTAVESTYVEQAGSGRLPVACTSPGHAYEKGLVFFPKRLSYDLDDMVELGIDETYGEKIARLEDLGLVDVDGRVLRLTEEGKRTYSELMVGFFSDQQQRLYRRVCNRLQSEVGVVTDDEWRSGSARIRSLGAFNAMTKGAARRRSA